MTTIEFGDNEQQLYLNVFLFQTYAAILTFWGYLFPQ